MEEYRLLTKDRETISSVKCDSFEEAVKYFAEMKKLSVYDLLSIFIVQITSNGSGEEYSKNIDEILSMCAPLNHPGGTARRVKR
jgi:hypothetical protein